MDAPEIWCDTRQQAGKHTNVDKWFDEHGIKYSYRKLDFGDYMREGSNVSIDTKQSMDELASNLGKDHARFARECERARSAGCRLVILVERKPKLNSHIELARWIPVACRMCGKCDPLKSSGCRRYRFKPLQGATASKIMDTMSDRYGVKFEFCTRSETASKICELLGVEVE